MPFLWTNMYVLRNVPEHFFVPVVFHIPWLNDLGGGGETLVHDISIFWFCQINPGCSA